jgi:benzoylformate decarboxylase/acetolactate synthase-1/2/3 large subunit
MIVDLLCELGIEYAAFNPGATFRGLHDSIVNYSAGRLIPIECAHEEISVAIAHGYAKAAGRPMAAIVHDVVGLQHATMAVYNAWCDRVPVLVLGGTGPMDSTRRRPWIDWIHTANVQGELVRDYTKWDDQPASMQAVPEALIRAVQLASAQPQGPVYICLDHDIQEDPLPSGMPAVDVGAYAPPARLAPDPAAVVRAAEWLVTAKAPVVIADRVGRSQRAVSLLVELVELVAIPVIDGPRASMNFPSVHPMNLSGLAGELIPEADVVLGLESRDLAGAVRGAAPSARIINVSLDSLMTRAWTHDFQRLVPAALTIPADLEAFLEPLLTACHQLLGRAGSRDRVEVRRRRLSGRSEALRAQWAAEAAAAAGERPIAKAALAATVWERVKDHDFVLANGRVGDWLHRIWRFERADQYLGLSGGAGLGYGLGASIGAALAHRGTDRLIVDIQPDGDALFTPAALWTLAHEQLPVLVVMDNNRAYNNSVEHAEVVARKRSRPVEKKGVATDIDGPPVDFATLARSFGVHGEGPCDSVEDLGAALDRALRVVVEERRPALVDAVTARD